MLEKKMPGKDDENESKYKPSAPNSTGTIPRRCSKPPPFEFEGLYECEPPVPSAPPLEEMEEVVGYESTTFSEVTVPPPLLPSEAWWDQESLNRTSGEAPLVLMTERSARDALINHARQYFCYGVKAAQDMAMTSFTYSSAYHYELQTFTEKRETSWKYRIYRGSVVDDSDNGPAPLPWEIEANPTKLFVNEERVIPVPHTESVKQCHTCKGNGSIACNGCSGKGWTPCPMCSRQGLVSAVTLDSRCRTCIFSSSGRGCQDCLKCHSKGMITCISCDGHCNLLYYIALTVTWTVNTGEHIVDGSVLPEDMLRVVSGQVQCEEEGSRVLPIQNIPNEAVRLASIELIREHLLNNRNQQILAQRHQVRVVPITRITYNWKEKEGEFHVCGYENKIYAPNYPQKCCCGCVLC